MKKESGRGHHYIPRCYLKRFSQGRKLKLHVEEVIDLKVKRVFYPNVPSFLVECGIYDLSNFKEKCSPSFDETEDGFLEDLLFAKNLEPQYDNALKNSIDINFFPDSQTCKKIIQGVWTLYLRTPKVRRANEKILAEIDLKGDENREYLMENFGMMTTKTIIKLLPNAFLHTKSVIFNAVGEAQFLTTDHPAIPCIYDFFNDQIIHYDEYRIQQSVILADEWPAKVGLLCALSPKWCLWTRNVQNISSIECIPSDSHRTRSLNRFIRRNADKFVILPPSKPS